MPRPQSATITLPLSPHDMASGALAPQEPHDPYSFKPGESCKQQKEDFIMAQRTGALVFDERTDRYDISL